MKCLNVMVCICITGTAPTLRQCRFYLHHSYLINEMWTAHLSILTERSVGAWTLISAESWQNRGSLSTDCLRNWYSRECILTFHLNIKICTYIEETLGMSHYVTSQNSAGWKSQDCFQKEVRTRIQEIWHDWHDFERLSENIWLELYNIWIKKKSTERTLRCILQQDIFLPWFGN